MDLDLSSQNASDKVKHLSGWRDLNSRPLDPQIGGSHYAALPERAGPMKAARNVLACCRARCVGPKLGPNHALVAGVVPDGGRCGRVCDVRRRYASGAAESAAISARAAATSSLLVWA